ncbi:ABC transporter permease [Tissierella praeacuta]|uniref:Peptide/nickel transport system permease protein n=2 Tax=Tissierella praeacuta TaxID=43131 RepID=A0A1M4S7G1_9FIRM|nr:ABC transporter permease [Tissierella praeacuta]MBU5256774.1 ABC transporter permease [Tissierella praeacuta]TCU71685.1 peptide/nickel transport system permease protein [Tissierella praeacuta]SHE28118.1 peptide/nickel transport system permease protein [Tissierella praeacuta DSM 18095]SUP01046.1 Glutathione transport system permease protein gsiC [Tissierella praeacuta]
MSRYIVKKILLVIPVLIGISLITFILLNVVPGDPVTLMMKEHVKPDVIERVRQQMNLDDPAYIRFFRFLWGAVQGDFGVSYKLKRPVADLLFDAFPNTLKLAVSAAVVSWIIGIPAGIFSAVKRNSFVDNIFMGFSLLGVSIPVFWAGLLFQYIFSLKLGLLPVSGFTSFKHLVMPSIVLGWSSAGTIARLTRSNLLEVMRNDYIRTARAKGNADIRVIVKHALKNSMLPVVTVMALQVAGLLSGAVITESVFGIPGIGRIAVNAIQNRDMPLLQGSVIFTTFIVILGNLVADILYSFIDPRIKYN